MKKLKNPRRVNKRVSEEIYQEFQVSVPIGSGKYNTEANIQIIYSYFMVINLLFICYFKIFSTYV